jgi:N-acetylated-alpha-linked acidic dipeptidase
VTGGGGRRLGVPAAIGALLLAIGSTPGAAQTRYPGYTEAGTERQEGLEALLRSAPDTAVALRHMRAMSLSPHVAGTAAQVATADYVLRQMAGYGLDTARVSYRVFLPIQDSARLEILTPERIALDPTEPALAEDRATQGSVWVAMNGYSGVGDVQGPVVFANYGLPDDYQRLDSLGVSVGGAVVLARYGKSFRGIKAREAEARGAIGLILYSDPQDDGYFRGDVYPDGPMRPPQAVQRGSLYNGRGDPSTPGWPSLDGARRLPVDSMAIPTIPVLPIGYANASTILERLDGLSVPQAWQGGLPFRYHLGAGAVTVRLAVWAERGDKAYKTVANTMGIIRGSTWPDELVIAGGHRDAWGPGAVDNVSGIVSLLGAAQAWGEALRSGYRPERTVVLATWDAEEWGLVGSVEWVEAMSEELRRNAVVYLNQDVAVAGRNFNAAGSASLHPFVRDLAATVRQPADTLSVYQAWRLRTASDSADAEPRLGNLGGGSDFAGFYNHLGIPSFGFGFGGPYGVYHSAYDSYDYMTRFSDPGALSHAAAARLAAVMTARMANAAVVPFDYEAFGRHLADLVDPVSKKAVEQGWDAAQLDPIERAARGLEMAGARFNTRRDAVLRGAPEPDLLAGVNAELRLVEQALARPEGLEGRPWMRNLVFAADRDNGYATIPLPSVSEAIRAEDRERMQEEVADLVARIRRATAALERAAAALGTEAG